MTLDHPRHRNSAPAQRPARRRRASHVQSQAPGQQASEQSAASNWPKSPSWLKNPATAFTYQNLLERLLGAAWSFRLTPPALRVWYWLAPILTAVIAAALRFPRLGEPHALVFDETYYVKDAYSFLLSGFERNWGKDANTGFVKGDFSAIESTGEYVVHPPVGKWMIAGGMQLFGPESSFGWRFSSALVGTIAVLIVALLAQKLFRSTVLGAIAGLLLAIDGHAIVQSRTALLDNFVMFFALLSFAFLVLDRDDGRKRLARKLSAAMSGQTTASALLARPQPLDYGPWLGIRWWRVAAGVSLGLCTGTKWTGLFFIAAFGLLTIFWDVNARRIAGIRYWFTGALLRDSPIAFVSIVVVAAGTYLATWTGWFLSSDAYDRQWAANNPAGAWGWVPAPLRSLWAYHQSMYASGLAIESDHPYKANAWSWFVMGRPTSFYAEYPSTGCGSEKCASVVNSVGNPLIWWFGAAALILMVGYWLLKRDWRAGAIACAWAAGYLPWFMYPNRTIFFFYAIAYEPYMILAITFTLGLILGNRDASLLRRRIGWGIVGLFLVLSLVISAFFYSIWTAETIPYIQWQFHMWMPSWI